MANLKNTINHKVSWRNRMKTYTFKVILEPDEDAWSAFCPALIKQGAATWGRTKEEALKHIQEVVYLVVESMIEHGEKIPESGPGVEVRDEPIVTVTV